MSDDGTLSSRSARRRQLAEQRLSEKKSEGGFWYSVADCQRMVHELQVSQIELDLIGDELAAHDKDLEKWSREANRVQEDLLATVKKFALMADGPEKNAMAMQCIEATLRLFEGWFKLLMQGGRTESL